MVATTKIGNKARLGEYSLFSEPLTSIKIANKTLINTINQYSYCIAEEDAFFKEALQHSDILLPDGVGMVAAWKILKGKKINKIAGADLHDYLLKKLNAENGSCFYLGSSESTLSKISNRLKQEYPNINVGYYSPPYKPEFSPAENAAMIDAVNSFKPDVLFVGMTAPKQEKWAYSQQLQLDAKLICSIGAVFDFYAGTVKRPGKVWISLGLEWAGRLVSEPKRMWKRYLYYGPLFVAAICREKIISLIRP